MELLLQAAGSWEGYKEMLMALSFEGGRVKTVSSIPSILAALEDMSGQRPEIEDLRPGEHGGLEMSREDGHLLLPSISTAPLHPVGGKELKEPHFSKVVISIQLNSDAWDRGLGIVVEQPPSMQSDLHTSGLPMYIFSGWGVSKTKNSNVIKFHPGMRGGQLRIEGAGGFANCDMGFTPQNWTQSERKFHTFQVTIGTDGRNQLKVISTTGQVFSAHWRNKLTDGKFMPAVYAWLDLGGNGKPLFLGDMSLEIHLDS